MNSMQVASMKERDDIYKWVGLRIHVSFPSDKLRLSKWNHKLELQK